MNAKSGTEMVIENQEMVMEKSWKIIVKYVGTLLYMLVNSACATSCTIQYCIKLQVDIMTYSYIRVDGGICKPRNYADY